jgi:hypothetical protein
VFPTAGSPRAVVVADLNGDGRRDLVTANSNVNNVSVLLGDVPPVVLSIDKQFPAGPSSIDNRAIYRVTFSEPVTGVDPSDFALALNGVTATTPVQLTGSGAVYTVTINGISGNGTFGLNLVDDGNIKDAAGNPLQPGGVAEFMPAQSFATGRNSQNVAVSDLNGDGKPDLVVTNTAYGQESISVLLGNGDGTFQSQQMLDVGNFITSVGIADVNGDGKPDLIVGVGIGSGPPSGAIAVLLGNGNGTFQSPRTFAAGSEPGRIAIADVNGDGRPDVVVAGNTFGGVLLGNGNGTFQPMQTVLAGEHIGWAGAADLTGDGKTDLAFSVENGISSFISVLLGNADGTFSAPRTFADPSYGAMVVADVNNDGKPDLVMNTGVLLGNGNGTFKAESTFTSLEPTEGYSVAVADVNGDGKLDVVTANPAGAYQSISVFLGNGNGTFAPQQTFSVPGFPLSAAISDLNGDGRPDIVAPNGFHGVDVLLGNNTGSFTGETYQIVSRSKPPFAAIAAFGPQQTVAVGSLPRSVATADLNGDGKPDLIAVNSANNSVSILLGNGNGTFAAQRTVGTGPTPSSVAVADVNHDGIPDLIVADRGDDDVSVLLGNGNGTFGPRRAWAVGLMPTFVVVSDVNGDGRPDILAANYGSGTVSVLLGNGNGTFQPQRTFVVGAGPISIAVADFNHDGKPDLAVANRGANSVSLLLGNGNGTFQSQATFATGSIPDWVVAADVNVDGSPDLVVSNQAGNSVGVLLGNGDGTFLPQQTFAAGPTPVSLAVANVNGDGSPDLIVTDYFANAVGVLLGNGDGTFQAIKTFATGSHPTALAVADFNRDGRQDIIVANEGTNSLSVLLGDVPPHLVSINRTNPAGPVFSGSSVSYTVTFSEPVTGVDAGDFALVLNGLTASAPVVTPVSGSVYTVTIGGISGAGTLGLNLVDNGTIKDAAGNPLQPGGVSFQPQQSHFTLSNPDSVVAADVNLDGQPDLIVGLEGAGFALLPGNGNGRFGPPQGIEGGPYTSAVAVADLNGDGKPDLLGGTQLGPRDGVAIALGNGDGKFRAGQFLPIYYSRVYSIAVGDINGDGIPDVVAAAGGDYPGIYTFLGNGDGTFTPGLKGAGTPAATPALGSNHPNFVTFADVKGDGTLDIIEADSDGTVAVGGALIATGANPVSIAAADVNGDGKIDLIVANQGSNDLSILLGNGNGTFQPQQTVATGASPNSVAVADVNGDGIPDLVLASGYGHTNGTVGVFLGNGTGTFQPQQTFTVGPDPTSLYVADVNGDGRPDLIVSNHNSVGLSVLLGNSTGSFTGQVYETALPLLDTINGTPGNDQITLSRDPDGIHIDWFMPGAVGQVAINDPNGLTINGNGGNDVITLDYTNGNPLPNTVHLNGTFTIDNLQGANPLAGTSLDIGRSTVFVSYSSTDPLAAIQAYLKNGYNGGAWNGVPMALTGVITSAAAQSNAKHNTAIGYADSADGAGINTTPNTIELKYTLAGDTNLDRAVNTVDLQQVLFNFNTSGNVWDTGDFNYDGNVVTADLQALLFNFNTTLGSQATAMAIAATPGAATLNTSASRSSSPSQLLPPFDASGSTTAPVRSSQAAKPPARKRR